ncbi:hypothetical protein P7228_10600 [Altererythrobacter arenosus]|uniref:Uncharacterized protein n=1 Tax=Altererythrobacter arenosus TaxID=3032592 RepID=A0ABY8FTL5_9SPHN|nr:hypothetical protein [Altererythrobacter sp. CAU 1644]WFL76446.1 hypothetical protein P7228_10600 [Altererythrobacter sp. CAU 1644]
MAALLLLAACKPPPTDEDITRFELADIGSGPSKPIDSPDTENALWAYSTARPGRIIYGNAGEAPLLAITCDEDEATPAVRITRFAAADEGAGAMLALIGNGHRSRLKVDAVPLGDGFLWEGSFAPDDPQLEVLTGRRGVTATIPGAGILTLNPSDKPSELIEACRGDDQPEAVAEDFLPEPDLSDEPFQ